MYHSQTPHNHTLEMTSRNKPKIYVKSVVNCRVGSITLVSPKIGGIVVGATTTTTTTTKKTKSKKGKCVRSRPKKLGDGDKKVVKLGDGGVGVKQTDAVVVGDQSEPCCRPTRVTTYADGSTVTTVYDDELNIISRTARAGPLKVEDMPYYENITI